MGTLQYVSIAGNTFDFNLLLCWVPFSWDHDKFIIKEKKQKHDVVIITYVKYFCFLQRDQNWWCFHWDRRRSSCSLSSEFSSEISLMRCVIHLLLFDSQWLAGCRPACWSREVAGHTTWLLVTQLDCWSVTELRPSSHLKTCLPVTRPPVTWRRRRRRCWSWSRRRRTARPPPPASAARAAWSRQRRTWRRRHRGRLPQRRRRQPCAGPGTSSRARACCSWCGSDGHRSDKDRAFHLEWENVGLKGWNLTYHTYVVQYSARMWSLGWVNSPPRPQGARTCYHAT